MIAISLDASTSCIGWSIWDEDKLVDYGKLKPLIDKLEWRERIQNFIPQLHDLMKRYKPQKVYIEDVPLYEGKKGKLTLVQLGSVQGSLIGLCYSHNVEMEFIPVSTWRKNIGILVGKKDRDTKKIMSINKANELFGINLNCVMTKGGNYNSDKSDDDISDSILLYASTRDKYKNKPTTFGRR